ncbi:DUF3829 domain-containing protein [Pseudomonas sp. RW409]|uniref:DUF3829 domain-containing protein n=1 Tax=Pseudomonas sp. RW409 TaxID=2202895 RepID=UPI000D72F1CD|nr:DUF3829 domain-containing protein [Pseudomonas sp. RW409]PWY37439.1 hypothetical protein DK261_21370 [Pseudomonas sp. RW409]
MIRQTLTALCLVVPLTMIALGLLSNTGTLASINGWLHRPGAEQQARASVLRPLIDCINRVDTPWRLAYFNYRARGPASDDFRKEFISRYPELFQRQRGPQLSSLDNKTRRPDLCLLTSAQKASLREEIPSLAALHVRYVQELLLVNSATQLFDFYPTWDTPPSTDADRAERDTTFIPLVESFLVISSQLRKEVDDADRQNRLVQLEQLKARDKFHAAFVLELILKTQDTMTLINNAAAAQTLNQQSLAQAIKQLRETWDKSRGASDSDYESDGLQQLWREVKWPAANYLRALETLDEHWAGNASPQQLSDDFAQAQRRYDLFIEGYNQAVGQTY